MGQPLLVHQHPTDGSCWQTETSASHSIIQWSAYVLRLSQKYALRQFLRLPEAGV